MGRAVKAGASCGEVVEGGERRRGGYGARSMRGRLGLRGGKVGEKTGRRVEGQNTQGTLHQMRQVQVGEAAAQAQPKWIRFFGRCEPSSATAQAHSTLERLQYLPTISCMYVGGNSSSTNRIEWTITAYHTNHKIYACRHKAQQRPAKQKHSKKHHQSAWRYHSHRNLRERNHLEQQQLHH